MARRLSSFYDSQSGRHVTLPTSVQCHVSLAEVAPARRPSCLRHLVKGERLTRGVASVLDTVADDAAAVADAARAGHSSVWIQCATVAQGVEAVRAAHKHQLLPRALLSAELAGGDAYDLQVCSAELADAGAQAIILPVDATVDPEELRERAELACEVDLEGVPMRLRLGLLVGGAASAVSLAQGAELLKFAHGELGLLHHVACLAGRSAARPSELLQALGVPKADVDLGKLFLAEHVPDAA